METPSDWTLQLSIKIDGDHMLNIRAGNELEFLTLVKACVESDSLLQSACRALEGTKKATPVSTPRFAPAAVKTPPGAEVGPVTVLGVDKVSTKRDGTPMKSPKYTVRFSDRRMYSTFQKILADAAETLQGQNVYYATEKQGDYENLASVRSAGV